MSDPSQPSESPGSDPPIDAATETNVEALLDHMADSAEALRAEVGAAPAAPPTSARIAEIDALETEPGAALDQQLAQAQDLLETTERELGAVAESLDALAAATPRGGAPHPSYSATPLDLPVVDLASAPAASVGGPMTGIDGASSEVVEADDIQRGVDAELSGAAARSASAPLTLRTAGAAVTMLDLMDRPFARLSYSVRRLIGWCAIATMIVAATLIAMSFLHE